MVTLPETISSGPALGCGGCWGGEGRGGARKGPGGARKGRGGAKALAQKEKLVAKLEREARRAGGDELEEDPIEDDVVYIAGGGVNGGNHIIKLLIMNFFLKSFCKKISIFSKYIGF